MMRETHTCVMGEKSVFLEVFHILFHNIPHRIRFGLPLDSLLWIVTVHWPCQVCMSPHSPTCLFFTVFFLVIVIITPSLCLQRCACLNHLKKNSEDPITFFPPSSGHFRPYIRRFFMHAYPETSALDNKLPDESDEFLFLRTVFYTVRPVISVFHTTTSFHSF
jgi:hypothetical protein